ncbi:putative glutamate--cysteine ligase 2 [Bienertia sinuspersici]
MANTLAMKADFPITTINNYAKMAETPATVAEDLVAKCSKLRIEDDENELIDLQGSDKDIRAIIANLVSVLDSEKDDFGVKKFYRIKKCVDVNKPLRRYQRIKYKVGNIVTVHYKSERLPFFCLKRGIIGHSEKDCVNVLDDEGGHELGWGT